MPSTGWATYTTGRATEPCIDFLAVDVSWLLGFLFSGLWSNFAKVPRLLAMASGLVFGAGWQWTCWRGEALHGTQGTGVEIDLLKDDRGLAPYLGVPDIRYPESGHTEKRRPSRTS